MINKNKKSPELLAPAGDWESLRAAVANGADAVYFGCGIFNARRRAENFSVKDLIEVISFCHQNGVKAYLAANTLVKNSELTDYFNLISEAYSAGIDAVIIQHLSFVLILKENFPGMEVHLSTQAAVFNSYYSDLVKGADRIILPREFTLNQVKEFREKTGLPVEVFVQGALCFSMSGQCLFSSFLGGRSGNRGLCAQPCRKKYNDKFLLSTKDLCLVEKIPQLIEAGISSFKIEGRLRSPGYVAAATSVYRRAIDSYESGKFVVDETALLGMELAFSREYTQGMMFKESDIVTPEAGGKRGIPLGTLKKDGFIKLAAPLKVGDGVGIVSRNGVHGDIIRLIELNGKKITNAKENQFVKLFINAKPGDEIILSSGSQSNSLSRFKRKAKIVVKREKPGEIKYEIKTASLDEEKILARVYSLEDARKAVSSGVERVFYNILSKDYPKDDKSISPYVPRCMNDWTAEKTLSLIQEINPSFVLSGDLGIAAKIRNSCVYLDISANVFNDLDVGFWADKGITPIISPELSLTGIANLKDKRFVAYSHGRIPLMSTKYSLKECLLKDELGYEFQVRTESDYRQVLNSVTLALFDKVSDLRNEGVKQFFLDLDAKVSETAGLYGKIISGERMEKPKGEFTLGNYRKGVI